MSLYTSTSMALSQRDENLLWVGTEIFPALIAAVEHQNNANKIGVVYDINPSHAKIIAQQLGKKLKQPIILLSQSDLSSRQDIGFIFICDPVLHNKNILSHINQNNILGFSPFSNALERGLDASIVVSHHVRPSLNLKQIESKNITLKAFFIQVSTLYEP
jgi:hypothetical protein